MVDNSVPKKKGDRARGSPGNPARIRSFLARVSPPRLRRPVAFITGDALENPLDVLKTLIDRRADEHAEGGFEYPVANKGGNVGITDS